MIGRDEIAEAARYADARMTELGLPAWMVAYDLDQEGVVYVASQRALRAGMMVEGRDPTELPQDRLSLVRLRPSTQRLLPLLTANWLDGFAAGYTVKAGQL